MKVDIKKQLESRSYRVKGIDVHPTEPWVLTSLFTGVVQIWNYETQQLVRSLDVTKSPLRACRFIARKNWIVVGGDDMQIRVFNSNTLEKVAQFEAHLDYIRYLVVHPTLPVVLSTGDDMVIKMWNWEQKWACTQVFKGHQSYVLGLAINPKDPNTFASGAMDRTVKVWSLDSAVANYTLVAHETRGVNFVEYYPFADKPYLITTSDDRTIKVFDYQSKNVVATLVGHSHNVSFAVWHPELPVIISGSEDSTIKIWNARSYKLERTLNYGLERAWCVSTKPDSNLVAIGLEIGSLVLRLGRDEPIVSMDQSGRLVWAKHLEAFSSAIKAPGDADVEDSEVHLQVKDLGAVEMQPTQLVHSPNGQFVAVVGDGEYIVYTARAWRNKMFGHAQDFAWGSDSNSYATLGDGGTVTIYTSFEDRFRVQVPGAQRVFGGELLGVATSDAVVFYDWASGNQVSVLASEAQQVIWNDTGVLVLIVSEGASYVLRYDYEKVEAAFEAGAGGDEGVADAFEEVNELSREQVRTATWIGDCLVFTTTANRLNYLVGSETYTINHYDRDMFLLGYLPRDNALYLCDKDVRVVSNKLSLKVVEFQTLVLRGEVDEAMADLLPTVPQDDLTRVARFLEAQGLVEHALDVTRDDDHRFDLALDIGKLELAESIARVGETAKWRQLGDHYMAAWNVDRATRAYVEAGELDTLLLIYTSTGDKPALAELAAKAEAEGRYNLAFNALWFVGDVDGALKLLNKSGRHSEAALFALTYGGPIAESVAQWKAALVANGRDAIAERICDPATEPERFPADVGQRTAVGGARGAEALETPEPASQQERESAQEPAEAPSAAGGAAAGAEAAEEAAEKPAEEVAKKPADESSEKPVEKSESPEKPTKEPVEESAEKPADELAAQAANSGSDAE